MPLNTIRSIQNGEHVSMLKITVFTFALVIAFTVSAALAAEGKPGKVSGLYPMPYGNDAIYVAWDAPESGGEPERYLVQTRNVDGGPLSRKWVDADTMAHLFECLDAGETYKVRVRAANSEGRGPVTAETVELPDGDGSADCEE